MEKTLNYSDLTGQLEIFCGTGGVGKTTLATARALYWGKQHKKVLLMTVDPSKRLKQLLDLDENLLEGNPHPTTLEGISFHAMILSPKHTLKRLLSRHDKLGRPDKSYRILDLLTKPFGGLYEILAPLEIQEQLESGKFDKIIVDTAPGSHFLDLLEAGSRFKAFFDQYFIEFFFSLQNSSGPKKIFNKVFGSFVQSGLKKLLDYFERITGQYFIEEFIQTLEFVYGLKQSFLKVVDFEESYLKNPALCQWFLVTAADQDKAKEAILLKKEASFVLHHSSHTIMNRCQAHLWEKDLLEVGNSSEEAELKERLKQLHHSFKVREEQLRLLLSEHFEKIDCFPDVMACDLQAQILELSKVFEELSSPL